MAERMRKIIGFLYSALLASCLQAAELVPCPDCAHSVSSRAMMCPYCGCPGAAIQAAAGSNLVSAAKSPEFFDSLVQVQSDTGSGFGVCVQYPQGSFILTVQDLLMGAQTLLITRARDGEAVTYASIEIAADRNLARLAVVGTNVWPLVVSAAPRPDFAIVHVSTNNACALVPSEAPGATFPIGTPLVDASTNVVGLCLVPGETALERIVAVESWIPVQPLTFRTQTLLLRQAAQANLSGVTNIIAQIQQTEWLTPYLAQRAAAIVRQLQQEENTP